MPDTSKKGSIIVAGSGISIGHLTMETQNYIKTSDIVLHVLTDIVTETWIRENSKVSESMKIYYEEGLGRIHTYNRMTTRVLEAARTGLKTCVIFYGHPGIFVYPSHEIVKRARIENIPVRMLPGISAEDCLIADFGFDPGETGCQAFEATDFLLYERKPETAAWLIIWQPEAIGDLYYTKNRNYVERLKVLGKYLLKFYSPNSKIAVYEANTYSIGVPKIVWSEISNLSQLELTGISTLVIPPISDPDINENTVSLLGITEKLVSKKQVRIPT